MQEKRRPDGPGRSMTATRVRVVAVVQQALAIERGLDVIAHGNDVDRVPLAEGRWLDVGGGSLVPAPVVVVQPNVVLQGVGPDHIVAAVGQTKDHATRGIFPAGDWLKPHGDVDSRWTESRQRIHESLSRLICKCPQNLVKTVLRC